MGRLTLATFVLTCIAITAGQPDLQQDIQHGLFCGNTYVNTLHCGNDERIVVLAATAYKVATSLYSPCDSYSDRYLQRADVLHPMQHACFNKTRCNITPSTICSIPALCRVIDYAYICIKYPSVRDLCETYSSPTHSAWSPLRLPAVFVTPEYPDTLTYRGYYHRQHNCRHTYSVNGTFSIIATILDVDLPPGDAIRMCSHGDTVYISDTLCENSGFSEEVVEGHTFCLTPTGPYPSRSFTINYEVTSTDHLQPYDDYRGVSVHIRAIMGRNCEGYDPSTPSTSITPSLEVTTVEVVSPIMSIGQSGGHSNVLLIILITVGMLLLLVLVVVLVVVVLMLRRKKRQAPVATPQVTVVQSSTNLYADSPPPYEAASAGIDNALYMNIDISKSKEMMGMKDEKFPMDDGDEYEDVNVKDGKLNLNEDNAYYVNKGFSVEEKHGDASSTDDHVYDNAHNEEKA